MAAFYYTSGHKKCLAGDMGCCCVAVKQKKCHFNHRNKKINKKLCKLSAQGKSYLVLSHAPFLSEVRARRTLLFTVAVVKH